MSKIYVYDIETFPNYFLVVFKAIGKDDVLTFEIEDINELREFITQKDLVLIGYNNRFFDDRILNKILEHKKDDINCKRIKAWSSDIINQKQSSYINTPWISVDLMEISNGKKSLKEHEIRLRMPNVQELPFEHNKELTDEEKLIIKEYCINDIEATELLCDDLAEPIAVRVEANEKYPFLHDSATHLRDSSLGERVLNRLYFDATGQDKYSIKKPSRIIFNATSRILKNIRFISEENQKVLDVVKAIQEDVTDGTDEVKKKIEGLIFKIGDIIIPLKTGGVHNLTSAEVIESNDILDIDVSSYYPSLMITMGNAPVGLRSEWVDILKTIMEERLDAKAKGDTTKANIYKIFINAIYGKTGSQWSIHYDPASLLSVTLNGQLLLIMLAEWLNELGVKLISLNTDGILLDTKGNLDEVKKIVSYWENEIGLTMEYSHYTKYISRDINNYVLYKDNTVAKKKGVFLNENNNKPKIIYDAVLKHFEGEDFVKYIKDHKDIYDYLYAAKVRKSSTTKTVEKLEWNKQQVQFVNRWYISKEGYSILKCSRDIKTNVLKKDKVPNSENAVIVNKLISTDIPTDIDFDHYIEQASLLIKDIESNKPSEELVSYYASIRGKELLKKAKDIRQMGLRTCPKGSDKKAKKNPVKCFEDNVVYQPLEEFSWEKFNGIGAYTGQEHNLLAIDIDYPEQADSIKKFLKDTLVIWHGEGSKEDVLSLKKKGTVLYNCSSEKLMTTTAGFLKKHGYELLYGKKIVQLLGIHSNGEEYHFEGDLKELPKELLEHLLPIMPKVKKTSERSKVIFTDVQSEEENKLKEFEEASGIEFEWSAFDSNKPFIKAPCVYDHDDNKEMSIYIKQGKISSYCFGVNCEEAREEFVNNTLLKLGKIKYIANRSVNNKSINNIEEAFLATEKYSLVLASTGSGKTYTSASYILRKIYEDNEDSLDKYMFICSSKEQMRQFANELIKQSGTKDLSEIGILMVESSGEMEVEESISVNNISNRNVKVVITHSEYASRKGHSCVFYAVMKFVDENTTIIIDEFDDWVAKQVFRIDFNGRYRVSKNKPTYVSKCPRFQGYGGCTNCKQKNQVVTYNIDDYSVWRVKPAHYENESLMNKNDPKEKVMLCYSQPPIKHGNCEIQFIEKTGDSSEELDYENADMPFNLVVENMVNNAHTVNLYRYWATDKDGEWIDDKAIIENYYERDKQGNLQPTEDNINFPYYPCNVLMMVGQDSAVIKHFKKAKRVICLTGTLTTTQMEFTKTYFNPLNIYKINNDESRMMDELIIVGSKKRLKPEDFSKKRINPKAKMLLFRPTKKLAESWKNELKESVDYIYGINTNDISTRMNDNPKNLFITYSLGVLGRGINLGDYKIICVDSEIYKPDIAYTHKPSESLEEYLDRLSKIKIEDRATVVLQNLGRVLRRDDDELASGEPCRRVLIIEGLLDEKELRGFADVLDKMGKKVETFWVPDEWRRQDYVDFINVLTNEGVEEMKEMLDENSWESFKKRAIEVAISVKDEREFNKKLGIKRRELTIEQRVELSEIWKQKEISDKVAKEIEKFTKVCGMKKDGKKRRDIKNLVGVTKGRNSDFIEKMLSELIDYEKK